MADEPITDTVIADAIADTEREIFDEAIGDESLDLDGDKSLEAMDDDVGADEGGDADESDTGDQDKSEATETKPGEAKAEPTRDETTGKFVPSGRLREQTEARVKAEAERDAFKTRIDDIQRQFDAFKAGAQRPQQPQPQQQPQEPTIPDMFADPQGYHAYMLAEADRQATIRIAKSSFAEVGEAQGEKFTQAYTELTRIGEAEAAQFGKSPTVARILTAPNPGKELMRWHQQQTVVREIGDPEAFKQKHRDELLKDPEFLATAIEAARSTAKANGASTTRLPPSLNGKTGGSQHMSSGDPELYNGSDESIFAHAMR